MASLKSFLPRITSLFAAIEDSLLVLMLSVMIGLAGTQIVLRNLWDASISWGDPLLRVLVLWIGLLGAMVATRDDNHIKIDLVSRYLRGRGAAIVRTLTGVFSACVCALLAWNGARFVRLDWEAGVAAFGAVPAWLCELVIPVGFGVMAIRFLIMTLGDASSALRAPR